MCTVAASRNSLRSRRGTVDSSPRVPSRRRQRPPATQPTPPHRRAHQAAPARGSTVRANAAAAAGLPADQQSPRPAVAASWWVELFRPLEHRGCNAELLVLLLGETLCGLATTLQTTFLFVYLHLELGLPALGIVAAQGSVHFLCGLAKGASGVVGDIVRSQSRVIKFGTFLTFLCKPMMLLAGAVHAALGPEACAWWFFVARLCDQLSKNVREPCVNARVKQLAEESAEKTGPAGGESKDALQARKKKARQSAFALKETLGTVAIATGGLSSGLVLAATGGDYTLTMAASAVPPALALAWYAARLRDDNGASPEPEKKRTPVKWTWALLRATFNAFDPAYWEYKVVNVLLWFARFDVALLTLRAVEVVPKELLPAMIVTNMTMQILLTPVVGKIAGGGGAKGGGSSHRNALLLLLAGLGVMVAANACFVLPGLANTWGMFAGAALLGVHMALTHANLKATSAAMMPQKEVPGLGRVDGSAASFDASLLGVALLGSNAAAGALTDMTREAGLGNVGCFCGGAAACLLAGLLLIAFCTWGHLGKWAVEKDAEAARKTVRKAAEEAAAKAEDKAAEPLLA
ncbi:hypothetical protein CHLRE_02g119650v5 [Chlamydomonas reinhardtii]|uniref:Uncharacterized protein n=1 Tax=Chlamydomonas reinhardtii TaxID=3055 RepID=A0A2K3E3K0_CHLRE|nr:uncharacterized protein CHLRE_02g119650v5 [Chlamydomonas reinhardtii]PNW87361.1 hypothetical protein CHLRE_02g119650v5 [Chlamydomonas reinhardtii]